MTAHTAEQREFIVLRLARFLPLQDILIAFRKRFPDTDCTELDVSACDPRETVLPPELHAKFFDERERILADPRLAPFTDRAARLFTLSQLAEMFLATRRIDEARSVFRQIREEQLTDGSAPEGAPGDDDVTEITRTIVDPVPAGAT